MVNKKRGFIVHPWETGDGKYQASYGNHNRTNRSFKTLGEAKRYLASKGVNSGLYDAPTGTRIVKTKSVRRVVKRRASRVSSPFSGGFVSSGFRSRW